MANDSSLNLLVAAFCNDPFYLWLFPKLRQRQAFLYAVIQQSSIVAEKTGKCIETDNGSLHLHAGSARFGLTGSQMLRLIPVWLRLLARPRRTLSAVRLLSWMQNMHTHHCTTAHMYIPFLATAPAARGTGAGSRLLASAEQHARDKGMGIYLETTNPRNTGWYEKRGYQKVAHRGISGCPEIWAYKLDV